MVARGALLALSLLICTSPALAAPVATNIVVEISFGGLAGGAAITFSGAGTVSVTGSTVSIAAGAVSLPAPVVIPLTATTALTSITARTISNQAGTFSMGGATAQAPGEACSGAPSLGVACNAGGGVGGLMGLSGFFYVAVIPGFGPIPFSLDALRVGQGGATTVTFDADAAAWSTRTGWIGAATGTLSSLGAGSPLTLITPTYVNALGLELPILSTLTFTNVSLPVPEPGLSAVLLGALGLGWVLLAKR